jgi:cytoskeletal protein CcmA (bactofilin family)
MSRITSGLKIRGELSGSSDLYIDGETQGKIQLGEARVTVGPNGRVQADVDAREINIEGTVKGNLKARESVRLGPSSQVEGSVLTPRIGIDDGARLRGKVEMTRPDDTRKPSKTERATNSGNLQPSASRSESE